MKTSKNMAIEVLRIIAASLIILHHHQQGTGIDFLPIAFYGGTFDFGRVVELFFLISGFFMFKHVEDIKPDSSIVEFGKKRIMRLFPMLFITIVFEFILLRIKELLYGELSYPYGIFDLFVNLLGLQQLGIYNTRAVNQPTWFISVLLLCYFVFFVTTKFSKRKTANPFVLYGFVILFASAIFTYGWNNLFLNRSIARGLVSFFLGIYLGKYISSYKAKRIESVVILLPVAFLLLMKFKPELIQSGIDYLYILMLWIPLLMISSRLKLNMIGGKVINLMGSATVSFLIAFFLANWVVGIVSHCFIERPINNWLNSRTQKSNYSNTN